MYRQYVEMRCLITRIADLDGRYGRIAGLVSVRSHANHKVLGRHDIHSRSFLVPSYGQEE